MLPASPVITLMFLVGHAILGGVIGVVSGWLTYALARVGSRRLPTDFLIGILGYFAGFSTCFLPWHENTISYRLSGGQLVLSTANYFQYYERVAIIVAVTLPCLYELNRFFRARRSAAR